MSERFARLQAFSGVIVGQMVRRGGAKIYRIYHYLPKLADFTRRGGYWVVVGLLRLLSRF